MVLCDGVQGNYAVQAVEANHKRYAVLQRCDGGWWHTIQREACPLTRRDAISLLASINTIATPKYNKLFRLLTEQTQPDE